MKIAAIVILIFLLAVLGNEIYFFWKKNQAGEARYQQLQSELGIEFLEEGNK